jgi:hypothetical protein
MEIYEFISLAQAKTMSRCEIETEIGKRSKFLHEQFGLDPVDASNFVSSLLNLGVVMNEKLQEEKAKRNS